MDEKLILLIERGYGVKLTGSSPCKKGKTWRLESDRGPYFFKSFVFRDGPRLRFIDGAMRHLLRRGFDHIIPFERTVDNSPYITHAGAVYFMTPFLEVRHCDYDDPAELSQAVRLLAGLHLASHGYRPPSAWNPQEFWGHWPRRMKEKIQHLYTFRTLLKQRKNWDAFDQCFSEYFPHYFQQAHEALDSLLRSPYYRLMAREQRFRTICHHDYEYHNILIDPENRYFIIDFDYLLCDTHLHDLASLLIRAGKRSGWEETRRERVLREYHSIYPLQPEEIPVLRAIMLFPQAFWQVAFARYFEDQPWSLNRFTSAIQSKVRQEDRRLRYIDNLRYPE